MGYYLLYSKAGVLVAVRHTTPQLAQDDADRDGLRLVKVSKTVYEDALLVLC